MIKNMAQGSIFYGIHFYPGVAEYKELDGSSYRIFLNEKTIRSMDSNFAGKPVFVEHVENVSDSVDEVKNEADGWVVESFFNSADGKHWVKFVIVSENGKRAVKNGMRLSNAYIPKTVLVSGVWNGVEYSKEVVSAEYEHLAIVENPRYEESVILTPEQFKKYNEQQKEELIRIANSKEGDGKMKLNFFKREKVENAGIDIESTRVELPLSKKEFTISEIVNAYDKVLNMDGYASPDHMVKVGNEEMSVKQLVKKHMEQCNDMEEMKKSKEENSEESLSEDEKDVGDRGSDKNLKNKDEADDDINKEKEESSEKKKNEVTAKAKAVKNAGPNFTKEFAPSIDLMADKLARAKNLFSKE